MTTVIAINHPDPDHLVKVIAEMRHLGVPTLRAIKDETQGVILALEGSHRLAAAQALGLVPRFDFVADNTLLRCAEIGYDDMGWFEGEPTRAADIRDRIGSPIGTYACCPSYTF